jgi:hypothetical protein
LTVIAKLLSRLEAGDIRDRKLFAVIPTPLKHRANQIFVFPREAPKQNRDTAALVCREGSLDWPVKMVRLVQARDFPQTRAFRL